MRSVLDRQPSANERLDTYNAIAGYLWHYDPTTAALYADSAYQLAENSDYASGRVEAYANKGIAAYTAGDYSGSAHLYSKAIDLAAQNNLPSIHIFAFYISLLKRQGSYLKALKVSDSLITALPPSHSFVKRLQLGKVDSYIELGQISEAQEVVDFLVASESFMEGKENKADLYVRFGELDGLRGDYEEGIRKLQEAIAIYLQIDDVLGAGRAYLELGMLYAAKGNYVQAREAFNQSKLYNEKVKYPFGMAEAVYQLGALYASLGEYKLATEFFFKSLDIYEHQKNRNEIGKVYYDLGWVYMKQQWYEKSEYQIKQAIDISKEIGNVNGEATGYNYLGILYFTQKKYDAALQALNRALDMKKQILDKKGIADTQFNLAELYEELDFSTRAVDLYLRSYETRKELGNLIGIAISENKLGSFYTANNQLEKAKMYLDKSRATLLKLGAKEELLKNYKYTAEYFKKVADYKSALGYNEMYASLRDTVFSATKNFQIAEMESRYALESKEREIALLNLENTSREQSLKLQEETIRNQRAIIWVISITGLLVIFLLFIMYRLLQMRNKANKELISLNKAVHEQKEEITAQAEELQEAHDQIGALNEDLEFRVRQRTHQLKEAHKELDTFFYHASHDFRKPLTTFLGLVEIARKEVKDDEALFLFEKVRETAGSLDKMVNKLRAASIIGSDDMAIEELSFQQIINEVLTENQQLINKYNASIRLNMQEVKPFKGSKYLMKVCINNLIENALLYSRPEGVSVVEVSIRNERGDVVIEVKDNGQGIEASLQPRIFDMYFRANESSEGNGLGLYITKKAVEKMGGDITFTSEYEHGSSFILHFPTGRIY
ncbi:hypothetical protein C900_03712 [Fulvivirga imtechensis AK7]|uniref:histidine kinase n=2 Tax=Fulvivirga TaxID=396811 RepID=L8JQG8_9BACT|nr:hypothetical protein C900_03712 [Fulvivirga imtechensis AK7]